MRALIFNSGLGSRLGELTTGNPKCLVRLPSGETILHRQLRVLSACGVTDFVVTTGPWPGQVEAECAPFGARGCTFHFVNNPDYRTTNYIHSLWLARGLLRGRDVLMLHGDLVFDAAYVQSLLDAPYGSWGSVDPTLPVPEKDFSADVEGGEVRRVGVGITGANLVAFQAMYRLTAEAMGTWLDEVGRFEARGEVGVYAEDAANGVFNDMRVRALSYEGHLLEEVDTPEDLARVGEMARMSDFAAQPTLLLEGGAASASIVEGVAVGALAGARDLPSVLSALGMRRPLVVADVFFEGRLGDVLGGALAGLPAFSGYAPNPTYGQVLEGVAAFREGGCDSLVSLGGGSAVDVAKCVKLWAGLPGDGSGRDGANPRFCDVAPAFSDVPHLAVPTTAGTGSESTHFAVVYVDGEKRSVAAQCLQPDAALLAPSLLAGLPGYQRRSTMLDALCQGIESHWSAASSPESRAYSSRAIPMVMGCWRDYLAGDPGAARTMSLAANLAGRAINLTTTTLPHAMSYKLTSMYGLAHGHAVALCMPFAWRALLERGDDVALERLREVDALMAGVGDAPTGSGLEAFVALVAELGMGEPPEARDEGDLYVLASSVNAQRMGNFPVRLTTGELLEGYVAILCADRQLPSS